LPAVQGAMRNRFGPTPASRCRSSMLYGERLRRGERARLCHRRPAVGRAAAGCDEEHTRNQQIGSIHGRDYVVASETRQRTLIACNGGLYRDTVVTSR
jgi:hypothetical protein